MLCTFYIESSAVSCNPVGNQLVEVKLAHERMPEGEQVHK